jgi:quercetin dioxygenase-like cupin family protein
MADEPLPPDDATRALSHVDADDESLTHLGVVGDTYTILVDGTQTAGRYALIDMLVPAGGGPPPHRHDFEEMFHILEGELRVTLRGESAAATAGQTVNIPALAPHSFVNPTDGPVRMLCLVSPAGLERYFAEFGDPVPTRTSPAPELSEEEIAECMRKAGAKAAEYRIDMIDAYALTAFHTSSQGQRCAHSRVNHGYVVVEPSGGRISMSSSIAKPDLRRRAIISPWGRWNSTESSSDHSKRCMPK